MPTAGGSGGERSEILYYVETMTPDGLTWSWETQTEKEAELIFRAAFEEYGSASMYRLDENDAELIMTEYRTDTGFELIRNGRRIRR